MIDRSSLSADGCIKQQLLGYWPFTLTHTHTHAPTPTFCMTTLRVPSFLTTTVLIVFIIHLAHALISLFYYTVLINNFVGYILLPSVTQYNKYHSCSTILSDLYIFTVRASVHWVEVKHCLLTVVLTDRPMRGIMDKFIRKYGRILCLPYVKIVLRLSCCHVQTFPWKLVFKLSSSSSCLYFFTDRLHFFLNFSNPLPSLSLSLSLLQLLFSLCSLWIQFS